MDKIQAQNLVKETFETSFDENRFRYFIRNLLNHFDEKNERPHCGQYIPEAFRARVGSFERIGKYADGENEIDILIVNLKKGETLERARTAQRNFIAWYLNGGRRGKYKDGALIAFVATDTNDWRFSLVKMDYKFEEGGNGKTKVIQDFTPARRWSFLVGANENSHTAQSRLAPIVENDNHNPSLKDLEEAFNIEKVTKEFFEKYRDLFCQTKDALDNLAAKDEKIRNDFEEKSVNTVDFSKKLLGQIVFLYFLQKKGWFGVPMGKNWGDGDKKFLRNLFNKSQAKNENYFNDYLEPLFYEALAKERDDNYYSRFVCKIPFLNGGLFDPINNYDWVNTAINLPNELFSNDAKDLKTGDIGSGILDIFDRYNFTVKEDEPLEKEVAIDPEMLGKVFENLLEVKDRKSKGTYYTPREIVHYMCQQSLINYLASELEGKISKDDLETLIKDGDKAGQNELLVESKGKETDAHHYRLPESVRKNAAAIDEKLATIKVCDPAIGSGAFPVGMMNEIVKARETLSAYLKDETRTIYNFKRDCIQNSLYGVDIDPSAVEIAKLRLWLSLIVDEDDIKQIKPLPNLDYKIMQGNSLISEFLGIDFDNIQGDRNIYAGQFELGSEDEEEVLIKEFEQKKIDYQNEPGTAKKTKLNEVENLMIKLFELRIKNQKADYFKNIERIEQKYSVLPNKQLMETAIAKEKQKLSQKTGFDLGNVEKQLREFTNKNKIRPFFPWKLYFAEVFENGGFDVVITNPPYVGEKGHKELFREVKNGGSLGKYYQGKMDLFYFFFHLAFNLGNDHSQIAFITTNYYPTALGARKLREDFKNRAIINKLVNFNELKIFETAMGQHNMVTILSKGQNNEAMATTCITKQIGVATPTILENIVGGQDEKTDYFKVAQNDLYDGNNYDIRIAGTSTENNDPMQTALNKIKKQGELLGKICNVNQGIVTGADKVSQRHIEKYGIDAQVGDGIFVLSEKEIKNLSLTEAEKQILKPWFKNSDVNRWNTNITTNESILYLERSKESIENRVKGHLKRYIKVLNHRREVENGIIKWWKLQWPREKSIFENNKIIVPQRSSHNTFGYNEIPWYAASDVFFITEKDKQLSLKYILALINSKAFYLWLYHRGKRKGKMLELIAGPLSEIPIKIISKVEQKPFIEIVDKILAITGSGDYLENPAKQTKVKEYENQIDQMVYKLYGLTPEEIEIIGNDK